MNLPSILFLALSLALCAEDGSIVVNPNRPSFANPAPTTQPGVDIGLTHGAPRYSVFAGLTVGLGRFRKP